MSSHRHQEDIGCLQAETNVRCGCQVRGVLNAAYRGQRGRSLRYKQLDALRGIAAFTVVLHHLFLAFPGSEAGLKAFDPSSWAHWETWVEYTPLRGFANGRPAVVLFFVLSGFVLAASLEKQSMSYQGYLIRRFCRIYLPFAIAIAFAVTLFLLSPAGPIPGLTIWFNTTSWTAAPTPDVIAGHLAMTGRDADIQLNNVIWSLVHELRISVLFPFIALFAIWNWRVALGAGISLWLASQIAGRFVLQGGLLASVFDTAGYTLFFAVGAICFHHRQTLATFTNRLNVWVIACAALCLMSAPAGAPAAELIYGIASVALIGTAIGHEKAQPLLTCAPLLWLGNVSYSLYLFHLPLLLFTLRHWYGVVDNRLLVTGIIAISLVVAQLAFWTVERPSDQVGRLLTRRQAPA
ncbi:acyltransferase family protein [Rhizobium mesosinicum]|uniref:Acyltransferase n=1 Tax=Rhizobium mesosinicum TaxID=335017 RepID=A0ABS7GZG3_9HYPH|nr:acyltransferase [Rhizobium mesosinicum]MBW9054926.1 acyltransferase [Rhizobium mesosinicum]